LVRASTSGFSAVTSAVKSRSCFRVLRDMTGGVTEDRVEAMMRMDDAVVQQQ
jgi:hypothetical protein